MAREKEFYLSRLLIIICISAVIYLLPLPLQHEAKIVLSILVLSAALWVTETIPLFLTSLLATILIVLFKIFTFQEAVTKFADPILVLFFGGFLIAQAMKDVNLDQRLARRITARVKDDRYALLILMFVTAALSMWISNTATTVIMIPIALGIVAKFRKKMTNFSKAAVLGVAYSANIGGVGTIIGSPPNAITVAQLGELSGVTITFLAWMKATVPVVIILIPIAWLVLMWMFPFEDMRVQKAPTLRRVTRDQKKFLWVFGATILLWLTTNVHGLSASLIAIMGAVFLFLIRLLKPVDLNRINYGVLILFGGGLVLGNAMFASGLSQYFADAMARTLQGQPGLMVLAGVIIFSLALGALASNTATAAILIPVIIPLATILRFSPKIMAMSVGVAVSLDFLLPVGTPPNAIAYATGKISIKDMLKGGVILTIVSMIVLTLFSYFFWA